MKYRLNKKYGGGGGTTVTNETIPAWARPYIIWVAELIQRIPLGCNVWRKKATSVKSLWCSAVVWTCAVDHEDLFSLGSPWTGTKNEGCGRA